MNSNLMTFGVLQNSFVRGGFPPDIMFGCKTIDGDCGSHSFDFCPFDGNWPNSAGDDLDMNIPRFKNRQDLIQLPEAYQGFSAHDGHVQRPVLIHQTDYSIDQSLSLKITDLSKYGITPEVIRSVRITAWAR